MFNVDEAITAWRHQMAAGGIKAPEVLDELESHLRDDVEEQVWSGASQESAFEAAARRIGKSKALKNEFGKVNRHGAWGLRANPAALSILAAWLILMGLGNMNLSLLLFNGFRLPHYSAGQLLWASLSVILGAALFCRRWRVLATAWFALNIAAIVWPIAAHGLSASLYAYAPHLGAPGETVRYLVLSLLPVPYPVFYAFELLKASMWLFGVLLLAGPSIGNLFRRASA
ncbi:MAG TPA: permease prefix domain 1-containing protein [Dongiaceae bacterium]|nr:permease prefix domain 1-containing protein [Dongiaceae bacterium]